MDRTELARRLAAFVALGQREGLPFRIVRFDNEFPGVETGTYAVRVVAPWAAGKSFGERMDPLIDLLWRSTDRDTRGGIAYLDVSASEADVVPLERAYAAWEN